MRSVKRIFLAGVVMLLSTAANASFINGSTMSLHGDFTLGLITPGNLATVNSVRVDSVGVSGQPTGSFATTILFNTPDETGPFTPVNLSPFTEIGNFITFAGWTLDLKTLIVEADTTSTRLHLSGTGEVYGNNLQKTGATWSLSSNNADKYSMTVTAAVVPVPAAVWLFGSGLIGLVAVSRRKA